MSVEIHKVIGLGLLPVNESMGARPLCVCFQRWASHTHHINWGSHKLLTTCYREMFVQISKELKQGQDL